jgi:hypothetical protein
MPYVCPEGGTLSCAFLMAHMSDPMPHVFVQEPWSLWQVPFSQARGKDQLPSSLPIHEKSPKFTKNKCGGFFDILVLVAGVVGVDIDAHAKNDSKCSSSVSRFRTDTSPIRKRYLSLLCPPTRYYAWFQNTSPIDMQVRDSCPALERVAKQMPFMLNLPGLE